MVWQTAIDLSTAENVTNLRLVGSSAKANKSGILCEKGE